MLLKHDSNQGAKPAPVFQALLRFCHLNTVSLYTTGFHYNLCIHYSHAIILIRFIVISIDIDADEVTLL